MPRTRRARRSDAFDPYVWSGRALQAGFVDLARMRGLASMYPASDWSVLCSEPSWISARLDALEGAPLVKNRPGDAGELVGEMAQDGSRRRAPAGRRCRRAIRQLPG
jgi:hypothetical protein